MPIRPIDMQVMLPRVLDHHEAKQNVLHRSDLAHEGASQDLSKEEIKKRSSVNQSDKSSKSRVAKEDEPKQNARREKKETAEREKSESKQNSDKGQDSKDGETTHIDIRI